MSDFAGLRVALSSLYAQRRGLELAGHNVANANTEGYSRQRVDMAVGVIPGEIAVMQPENAIESEQVLQALLQLFPRQVWIARGGEQAAGRGKQGSGTVHLDGTALEYHFDRLHRCFLKNIHGI